MSMAVTSMELGPYLGVLEMMAHSCFIGLQVWPLSVHSISIHLTVLVINFLGLPCLKGNWNFIDRNTEMY